MPSNDHQFSSIHLFQHCMHTVSCKLPQTLEQSVSIKNKIGGSGIMPYVVRGHCLGHLRYMEIRPIYVVYLYIIIPILNHILQSRYPRKDRHQIALGAKEARKRRSRLRVGVIVRLAPVGKISHLITNTREESR